VIGIGKKGQVGVSGAQEPWRKRKASPVPDEHGVSHTKDGAAKAATSHNRTSSDGGQRGHHTDTYT